MPSGAEDKYKEWWDEDWQESAQHQTVFPWTLGIPFDIAIYIAAGHGVEVTDEMIYHVPGVGRTSTLRFAESIIEGLQNHARQYVEENGKDQGYYQELNFPAMVGWFKEAWSQNSYDQDFPEELYVFPHLKLMGDWEEWLEEHGEEQAHEGDGLFEHDLDITLTYNGEAVPGVLVSIFAGGSEKGADETDSGGVAGFDLTSNLEVFGIEGLTAKWEYDGLKYKYPLEGDMDPDLKIDIEITEAELDVKEGLTDRFDRKRFEKSCEDWGVDPDVYMAMTENEDNRNVKMFQHRCIQSGLGKDETSFVDGEDRSNFKQNWDNWFFLQFGSRTKDKYVTFDNPYSDSFIIVNKYKKTSADNVGSYVESFVVLPGKSHTVKLTKSITRSTAKYFQFTVLSGYAVLSDISSDMRNHLRDSGVTGRNLLNYLKDNERKLNAWRNSVLPDIWDTSMELDQEYYDDKDMGITAVGIAHYTDEYAVLKPADIPDNWRDDKEPDYSWMIGLIFIILMGVGVGVYLWYKRKKGAE